MFSLCILCPCLLALSFTNYAFYDFKSNLTSCSRPDLIECAVAEHIASSDCVSGIYGEIDEELFDEIGAFIVGDGVPFAFIAEHAVIALDAVEFVSDSDTALLAMDGTVFLVDSVVANGGDIAFNADDCSLILDERLSTDSAVISRLLMECTDFEVGGIFNVENAQSLELTVFVDHLSASRLHFAANQTMEYHPGFSVPFNYAITDRLGNVIDGADFVGSGNLTEIRLATDSFLGIVEIEDDGECPLCAEGIVFSEVLLARDVGLQYTVQIAMADALLVLEQTAMTFNVTGCPSGYGADSNNLSCTLCGAGHYNIDRHSVRNCLDCDAHSNSGSFSLETAKMQ